MILDRNGNKLAVTNSTDIVFADSATVKDHKAMCNMVAPVLGIAANELSAMITQSVSKRYVKLAEDISESQKKQIKEMNLSGIGIHPGWKRFWPNGRQTSHLIGFTGKDETGLAGLELKYENMLKGKAGTEVFITDAFRRPIKQIEKTAVENGMSIVLTVDNSIQSFVYDALLKQYKEYEAESAVAIVMEPATGAILAMVSLPDFSPEKFNVTDASFLKNRALSDVYEPGSIFKPLVVALAIDAEVVDKHEKIFCENGVYSGKGFGRIGEYNSHSYGNLTPKEILIHSSNIGMAKIGQKMGKKKLYECIRLLGFGRKTGVDLPGEDAGLLWPVKNWTGYSVTRIPYGQEISVTAMQVVRAYSVLANGGRAVKPHITKAIISGDGREIKKTNLAPLAGYVIKPETAKWVIDDAMAAVVNEGTGKKAKLEKWQVFGKTGTANIALPGGKGYDFRNYVASFIGGAPAENPQIVVLVSVRKPKRSLGKGYTGGTVAAPVVKEIIEKTLTYLNK